MLGRESLKHVDGVTPQTYRANHTTLALTKHWRRIYDETPLKQSKVNVYEPDQFCKESPASVYPLRLCNQCREEDLRWHVMTYWHREHHIAGIDICPTHGTALQRFDWYNAYASPNPLTLRGEVASDLLVQANFHPILTRYREAAQAVLKSSAPVQYAYAHEQLLNRAAEMGLCRRRLGHTGTSYLEHELPQYLYRQLPRAWMAEHLNPDFLCATFFPSAASEDEYHSGLKSLKYSGSTRPLYLLLALAACFDSTRQIHKLLLN